MVIQNKACSVGYFAQVAFSPKSTEFLVGVLVSVLVSSLVIKSYVRASVLSVLGLKLSGANLFKRRKGRFLIFDRFVKII